MPPSNDCLVIMARFPELGKCKTRLAKDIGKANALEIYRKLLRFTLETAQDSNLQTHIAVTPANSLEKARSWAPGAHYYLAQKDGDLGAKMGDIFQSHFNNNFRRIVIIGTDCAEIGKEDLNLAISALNHYNAVLGPASDGGYYLIGLNRWVPEIFQEIAWSTKNVLNHTLGILKSLGLSYILLPVLTDIDTKEDFLKFKETSIFQNIGAG